jgi:hypothetical protein
MSIQSANNGLIGDNIQELIINPLDSSNWIVHCDRKYDYVTYNFGKIWKKLSKPNERAGNFLLSEGKLIFIGDSAFWIKKKGEWIKKYTFKELEYNSFFYENRDLILILKNKGTKDQQLHLVNAKSVTDKYIHSEIVDKDSVMQLRHNYLKEKLKDNSFVRYKTGIISYKTGDSYSNRMNGINRPSIFLLLQDSNNPNRIVAVFSNRDIKTSYYVMRNLNYILLYSKDFGNNWEFLTKQNTKKGWFQNEMLKNFTSKKLIFNNNIIKDNRLNYLIEVKDSILLSATSGKLYLISNRDKQILDSTQILDPFQETLPRIQSFDYYLIQVASY